VTKREASQEAIRRWGGQGFAHNGLDGQTCLVGYYYQKLSETSRRKRIVAVSDTWELAFADADRREKGEGR